MLRSDLIPNRKSEGRNTSFCIHDSGPNSMDLSDALGEGGVWPGGGSNPPAGGAVWPGGATNPTWPGGAPAQPAWPGQGGPQNPAQPTWPGQGGPQNPAQPTWPGQGGPQNPAQPTWPGQGGPPAQPTWPGQGGPQNPAQPTWPGQGGPQNPAQPTWPGGAGAPAQPTWPGPGGPGGAQTPAQPTWPGQGGPTPPAQSVSMNVPFDQKLPNGVFDKLLITVKGTVKPHANTFTINIKSSHDLAFHFNVRFNEGGHKVIVRNSEISKKWGKEERGGAFPFVQGQPFEMKVLCTSAAYRVAVNGSHLLEYQHRVKDLRSINLLSIYKDVTLTSVLVDRLP
ncbi:galectin-3b isoform X1 [Gadus morhua]|uniref:galectin-3b isoform X1 n=2 Tax=Gadus morhua TaxID=8049 RepID=UPI0011B46A3C|nr:galectin-3-like isoform X1 [Gadus morhua]